MRRPYYQRSLRYRAVFEELPPEPSPPLTRRKQLARLLPFALLASCIIAAALTRLDAPPATVLPPLSDEEFTPYVEAGQSLVLPERRAFAPSVSSPAGEPNAPAPDVREENQPAPVPDLAPAAAEPTPAARSIAFVDTHGHAIPGIAVAEMVRAMDSAGLRQTVLMPLGPDEDTRKAADVFPGRFVPFAGGGSLLRLTQSGAGAWNLTSGAARNYLTALEEAVQGGRFRGVGELVIDPPVYADAPLVRGLLKLSSDYQIALVFTMNGTAQSIPRLERALDAYPAARVVWAGCGAVSAEQARRLLTTHANLNCDFSGRDSERYGRTAPIVDRRGVLTPAWKALLEAMPERFLVGTDARNPAELRGSYAAWARWHQQWLGQLSPDAAARIAAHNVHRIIGE